VLCFVTSLYPQSSLSFLMHPQHLSYAVSESEENPYYLGCVSRAELVRLYDNAAVWSATTPQQRTAAVHGAAGLRMLRSQGKRIAATASSSLGGIGGARKPSVSKLPGGGGGAASPSSSASSPTPLLTVATVSEDAASDDGSGGSGGSGRGSGSGGSGFDESEAALDLVTEDLVHTEFSR
jgi:hypothetical protein